MKMKLHIPFVFSTKWPFIRRHEKNLKNPRLKEKLFGISIFELICHWVRANFNSEYIIVLTDINVEAKNIEFWSKVPANAIPNFLQDVVVLRCKDRTETVRLIENLPRNFAEAYGFCAGEIFIRNKDF